MLKLKNYFFEFIKYKMLKLKIQNAFPKNYF